MKITILSDIHDNVWNLNALFDFIKHTDALIFCGDICAPFMLSILAKNYSNPIHMVFGNNDGDRFNLLGKAIQHPHVKLYGEVMSAELDGKLFYVNHYPEIALEVARSGEFDVICYGHDHDHAILQHEDYLAINPGTVMGFAPRKLAACPATFVIYDTVSNRVESFEIITGPNGKSIAPFGN
ncbi:YfcE family phosphodiesterase [Solitalea lacus]|uniref:YfcE family phosphodiesterase n=1 Tax=Solitalea lacus TaxID=2911172 RepID=UPI001ED9F3C2|nr:YfcE family phosphodiesterase [Solitalea lacus]UKJ07883.1 YfcE family phosphodiesterase [Solitalea lacus]